MSTVPPTGRVSEAEGRVPPSRPGLIAYPRVFVPAAGLLLVFVAITSIWPKAVGDWLTTANTNVVQELGWWYIGLVTSFVFFSIWLAASHMGNVVLGKDGEEPEFALGSWFAMLFAAGMGIGLVFWGAAEPLWHFGNTPPGTAAEDPAEAARSAMDTTFLHWGLHAWAIYVVVGLAVAYAVHRKGRPVSLRWALEPVLGDRVRGFWGDVIDVIAILGTLFGVATSLGLGVTQIGAGLGYLDVIDEPGTWLLIALIIGITAIALVSVVSGVDKGIKWLSNINMVAAAILVVAVMALGPTVFILSDLVTQLGSYVQNFFSLSFNAMPFQEGGKEWLGGWTTFYWGWWMSWAPFVGVFIARISRGRTVREFIFGVLLVPTLVTFVWFSVMGGTALYTQVTGEPERALDDAGNQLGWSGPLEPVRDTALFQLFETMPGAAILSGLAIFLVVIFFVTSSDSGSYVVDMLASGGNPEPPRWSRAFWAALEGAIAAVMLYVGLQAQEVDPSVNPLGALQTMAILLALPFSIVMVLMCVSTAKALLAEERARVRRQRTLLAREVASELERTDSR